METFKNITRPLFYLMDDEVLQKNSDTVQNSFILFDYLNDKSKHNFFDFAIAGFFQYFRTLSNINNHNGIFSSSTFKLVLKFVENRFLLAIITPSDWVDTALHQIIDSWFGVILFLNGPLTFQFKV